MFGVNISKTIRRQKSSGEWKNREWVTNENLFYHSCLDSRGTGFNRDCSLCPSFNCRTLSSQRGGLLQVPKKAAGGPRNLLLSLIPHSLGLLISGKPLNHVVVSAEPTQIPCFHIQSSKLFFGFQTEKPKLHITGPLFFFLEKKTNIFRKTQ